MLTVRAVQETDKPLLKVGAEADPYHAKAGVTGEEWVGKDSIMYEDGLGPVVALKTSNVVRVAIQFLTQDKVRNGEALVAGFYAYVGILQKRGVTEIVFHTESPQIGYFMRKRFHFRPVRGIDKDSLTGTFSLCIG
jgi:hypothetical protein